MLLRNRGRRLVRGWVRWRGRAGGEFRQADELHGRIPVSDAPVQHPNPHPLPFPLLLPSSEPLITFKSKQYTRAIVPTHHLTYASPPQTQSRDRGLIRG